MVKVTEAILYRPIIQGASLEGWLLWRVTDSGEMRRPFDIAGLTPDSRGVSIEVKILRPHPTEIVTLDQLDLRANQRGWLEGYSRHGAYALVLCYRKEQDDLLVVRVVTHPLPEMSFPKVVGSLVRSQTTYLFVGWSALWDRLRQT